MKNVLMAFLILLTFGATLAAGNILIEEDYFQSMLVGFVPEEFETKEQKEKFFNNEKYLGGAFFESDDVEGDMITITLNENETYVFYCDNSNFYTEALYYNNEEKMYINSDMGEVYLFNLNDELIKVIDDVDEVKFYQYLFNEAFTTMKNNIEKYENTENVKITNTEKGVYEVTENDVKRVYDLNKKTVTYNGCKVKFEKENKNVLPEMVRDLMNEEVTK